MSRYYEEARRFAALVTDRSRSLATPIYVCTGGGPGITGCSIITVASPVSGASSMP